VDLEGERHEEGEEEGRGRRRKGQIGYFNEEEWGSNQRKEERRETGWRGRVEGKERETTLFSAK